jgi:hypothetical protein
MGAKVMLVLASLACGLFVATTVFAYTARLAPELGTPLYRVGIVAVYAPWNIAVWAWWWGWLIPKTLGPPCGLGMLAGLILLLKTWPRTTHTTAQAQWATKGDLQRAECLKKTGIVLGKLR